MNVKAWLNWDAQMTRNVIAEMDTIFWRKIYYIAQVIGQICSYG